MRLLEQRQYEMFRRVVEFGRAHGKVFPRSSLGRQTFAELAGVIEEIDSHTRKKITRLRFPDRDRARRALRRELFMMVRSARLIASRTPGFDHKFRFPDPEQDLQLIAAGRLFAANAAPFTREFIAFGMPPTFATGLEALAADFERAIKGQHTHRIEHHAASAGIDHALRTGLALVRRLDVMVRVALPRNSTEAVTWRTVKRIAYPRVRTKKE